MPLDMTKTSNILRQIIKSAEDQSINIVDRQLVGFLESRYVRREEKYFCCYLSSQSGCNRGCKFCHLTATDQTRFDDSTTDHYISQATAVFRQYKLSGVPAKYVHFNYMARGEILANKFFLNNADEVIHALSKMAIAEGLGVKHNVSTIMPVTLKKSLVDIFKMFHPTIYYSMYSVNKDFRYEWIPAAHDVDRALSMLKEYQEFSKKRVYIHFAFIKGQNDSLDDIDDLCGVISAHELDVQFNIVRYNPFSASQGVESDISVIEERAKQIRNTLGCKVKIVSRVGTDVKASCGQFIQ